MNNKWWEDTSIYHIYPRSFKDTTGNGVGDLKGIINKLKYIQDIGFETIWLCPFFLSPGSDHGYDISDYYNIDPLLGDMITTDQLIDEVHKRGMKIIFDLVLNHTSINHNWFIKSSSSKNSAKRDWYIWADGKNCDGKTPPNNWKSMIGTSAWNYHKGSNQWYYSSYLSFQPDLNYQNPEVKKEMLNVVRFWLNKGVDGFRLDIFNCIGKDQRFLDNPFSFRALPTPDNNDKCYFQNKKYNLNHPLSVTFSKELRIVTNEFEDRVLIGEVSGNHDKLKEYIGDKHDGLNLVFLFELLGFKFNKKFFFTFLQSLEDDFKKPYIPTLVYSNHDNSRSINKIHSNLKDAKILALIQFTSRGVPITYYGEEIGMFNHDISFKDAKDPITKLYKSIPKALTRFLNIFLNRDDARTPMQWDDSSNRGFCKNDIKPWLPTLPNSESRDVNSQIDAPQSLLICYKKLLHIRKKYKALSTGDTLLIKHKKLLIYERKLGDVTLVIAINFNKKTTIFNIPVNNKKIIYSTDNNNKINFNKITLLGSSGVILI